MLLIYTTSFDTTVDLLIHWMKPEECFRLNFDLWRDYKLEISAGDFRIEDPAGRVIDRAHVSKVLYRKPQVSRDLHPHQPVSPQDAYCEEELWYALRDLVNLLWADGKLVLVEPRADMRVGKLVQARAAQHHFSMPDFRFTSGVAARLGAAHTVVKSLSFESVGGKTDQQAVYTTRVNEADLSPRFPWLLQEYVEAERDVTVVYVRDRIFAFELDRTRFLSRTADWRELPVDDTAGQWKLHRIPAAMEQAVFAFMGDLDLHFGRLDFLLGGGRYHFLEVNPNGQWGWLDADGAHGLLPKIVAEISPETPCHAIPAAPRTRVFDG